MAQRIDNATTTPAPRASRVDRHRRPRAPGFRSADILRTAALVIGMYLFVQLIRFAHPLFLTAFLGVLFGLAVSSGVDILCRWRLPRGLSAALIVISFFGLLVGFGAWMAPTLHEQGIELRRQLPDAIDRVEIWLNARRNGVVGMVLSGLSIEARVDSVATTRPVTPPPAAAAGQARVLVDTAHVATTLHDRLGVQLNGATRYLFPFLSSTVEIVTGLLIIVFLSI